MQVDVTPVPGVRFEILFRYVDANNYYVLKVYPPFIPPTWKCQIFSVVDGQETAITGLGGFTTIPIHVRIKVAGTTLKVWSDTSLQLTVTNSDHAAGTVAFRGQVAPKFDNLKIGYDSERNQCGRVIDDNDIDDAGDDLAVNETFGGTTASPVYDDAGNLIDDGEFIYVYDAWNRLVRVRAKHDDDVTIQTAEFDALGRRIKKKVENSGDYDKTEVYLYDGNKIIETRDGSGNMVAQFIHGTQYIDELVMMRAKDKGDVYVHQDANWNVVALTDLGGSVVERNVYTPYGQLTAHQETGYGDRDGDGDVDATDKGTPGTDCTGTVTGACRILDLDFDGDYDSADATLFDSLEQGLARHPGKVATGVGQPFAHQGLLFEPEIGIYQNRHRQYDPSKRRFVQRDPLTRGNFAKAGFQDGMNLYGYIRGNPTGGNDPLGLCSPFYGNWCGPGYSGGLCDGEAGPPAPPIDGTDSCCEKHDTCYDVLDVVAFCCRKKSPAQASCDRLMVRCLHDRAQEIADEGGDLGGPEGTAAGRMIMLFGLLCP